MGRSSIQGVGINDLPYNVVINDTINGKTTQVWMCQFYRVWKSMLTRCYSPKFHMDHQSYIDCQVVEEWHSANEFKLWMEKQTWEGNDLDKDLLVEGNKIYSPDTCVFISHTVNAFVNDSRSIRPMNVILFRILFQISK